MRSSLFIVLCLIVGFGCDKTTPIIPATQRLEQDIATIDDYLAKNNITAVKDTTGLRYVIHQQGDGIMPTTSDCVKALFKGSLLSDGSVFDESTTGYKTPLRQVILGWYYGFPKLSKGTKATFYVPSGLGYGSQARPGIPPNSILVFDVELLDVYAYNSTSAYCYDAPLLTEAAQNAIDLPLIDQYLAKNNITAQTDPGGVRYVVNTLGTGVKPTLNNCVRVSYTGKLLSDGSTFDQSTNYKAPLKKLIKGWQTSLVLFPKGSKVTLYIPSRMGYGPQSVGAKVPANANLVFDIEILDVTDYNATSDICN